jgi:hypothetical protein
MNLFIIYKNCPSYHYYLIFDISLQYSTYLYIINVLFPHYIDSS